MSVQYAMLITNCVLFSFQAASALDLRRRDKERLGVSTCAFLFYDERDENEAILACNMQLISFFFVS